MKFDDGQPSLKRSADSISNFLFSFFKSAASISDKKTAQNIENKNSSDDNNESNEIDKAVDISGENHEFRSNTILCESDRTMTTPNSKINNNNNILENIGNFSTDSSDLNYQENSIFSS